MSFLKCLIASPLLLASVYCLGSEGGAARDRTDRSTIEEMVHGSIALSSQEMWSEISQYLMMNEVEGWGLAREFHPDADKPSVYAIDSDSYLFVFPGMKESAYLWWNPDRMESCRFWIGGQLLSLSILPIQSPSQDQLFALREYEPWGTGHSGESVRLVQVGLNGRLLERAHWVSKETVAIHSFHPGTYTFETSEKIEVVDGTIELSWEVEVWEESGCLQLSETREETLALSPPNSKEQLLRTPELLPSERLSSENE